MKIQNKLKNPIVSGTLLLSFAGILGKIIGFFYKIFLSRAIGAEGLGIYQLIFPISTICFAVTTAGISTALSKYVAEYQQKDPRAPRRFLRAGIIASGILSLATVYILFYFDSFIAENILLEPRCTPLIRILACSVPLAAIHSCIHGYYYGKKKAGVPALSSLVEQGIRVLFVFFACQVRSQEGVAMDASLAVWGLVAGEAAAFLFCVTALFFQEKKSLPKSADPVKHPGAKLLFYSLPLTANRLTLTLFASFESILIPARLRLFGYSQSDALSIYGVLTGMAFSIVMFPTVFSNSVSVMLLPIIAEADSRKDTEKINRTIGGTIFGCLLFGIVCTAGFLVTGQWIGDVLFCNALAGRFITMLSFICPFLFLTSILSSILHGLGMAGYPFLLNLAGSVIRILFIYALVPVYGLKACLIGMLFSQIFTASLSVWILWKKRLQGQDYL